MPQRVGLARSRLKLLPTGQPVERYASLRQRFKSRMAVRIVNLHADVRGDDGPLSRDALRPIQGHDMYERHDERCEQNPVMPHWLLLASRTVTANEFGLHRILDHRDNLLHSEFGAVRFHAAKEEATSVGEVLLLEKGWTELHVIESAVIDER